MAAHDPGTSASHRVAVVSESHPGVPVADGSQTTTALACFTTVEHTRTARGIRVASGSYPWCKPCPQAAVRT